VPANSQKIVKKGENVKGMVEAWHRTSHTFQCSSKTDGTTISVPDVGKSAFKCIFRDSSSTNAATLEFGFALAFAKHFRTEFICTRLKSCTIPRHIATKEVDASLSIHSLVRQLTMAFLQKDT
jgi:hypothetical protein